MRQGTTSAQHSDNVLLFPTKMQVRSPHVLCTVLAAGEGAGSDVVPKLKGISRDSCSFNRKWLQLMYCKGKGSGRDDLKAPPVKLVQARFLCCPSHLHLFLLWSTLGKLPETGQLPSFLPPHTKGQRQAGLWSQK